MPLLALFSKKNKSSSKVSAVLYADDNASNEDDDYVSVASPSSISHSAHQATPSPSKRVLPFRRRHERSPHEQGSPTVDPDPLLEPPPRRSALFQSYQDDASARSTRSLPEESEQRTLRPMPSQQQTASSSSKKFPFSWSSLKDRGKSAPPPKTGSSGDNDPSFNLKSFRHVRPDSPLGSSSNIRSPTPPPVLAPIPTTSFPSPPIAFQVTSRRPRQNSVPELAPFSSSPLSSSQQKMAAGAFLQAARRSTASLTPSESPVVSPVRTSLDDWPPSSHLPSASPRSSRSQGTPQGTQVTKTVATTTTTTTATTAVTMTATTTAKNATYTPKSSRVSPSTPTFSKPTVTPSPNTIASSRPAPRTRTNAFAGSSSESSSSEDEEEGSESTGEAGDGARISRRRTIKQGQAQTQAVIRPPLSASAREQIRRATPPSAMKEIRPPAATMDDVPTAQSSIGVVPRPRASLSAGALSPSAKEARASIATTANARLSNATALATPRSKSLSLTRNLGSDTSESAASASDSDEDAPLASLVLPRRPGTSLSGHSASPTSTPRKVLVDLNAPSSLTGRPIKAPPPLAKEEEDRPRSKVLVESSGRSKPSSTAFGTSSLRNPSSTPGQSPPSLRVSQVGSPHTTASMNSTSPPSFSGSSGRLSSSSPNTNGGARLSSVGTKLNLSPVAPPMRPFARRESPASSTGDSSSGKAPLTPRDGSDTRSTYTSVSASRGQPRGHGRKPSVTFADEAGVPGMEKQKDNVGTDEARRMERRRGEARAAIELGNVVNGPPPVDEDDLVPPGQQHMGMQGAWPQAGMQMPMQFPVAPVAPMFNMGMSMPSPGGFGMNYPTPPPGPDPTFLAAHQQAMAIAKQTFQYAVAQQAMAAANEEWERSSSMAGFGGGGVMPGPQWGYGMGMGMGMRQNVMFPSAPRSMYAGSMGSGGGGGGWGGTGSVYGQAFGPGPAAGMGVRSSSNLSPTPGDRPIRPRTKTAPSAVSPPAGAGTSAGRRTAPPSSFRGTGR